MVSTSDPKSDRPNETSYIKMLDTTNDATLVGAHCQATYCNQLDFLPFRCQSCFQTFCGDHRTEDSHHCVKAGAWAERRRKAQLDRPAVGQDRPVVDRDLGGREKPCAYDEGCKTIVGTSLVPGVHCPGCNRDYCLKHRLREEHHCERLPPIGASPVARRALVQEGKESALNTLRKLKTFLPKANTTSSASQRVTAMMNMKKTAKGDAKLSAEKRVYLNVEAEASTAQAKLPRGEFFYSRDWVVGRMLDAAAKDLSVENINNKSSDEQDKLRVFHIEGGRLLEFNEKVGSVLQNGNTIVLLRGVGPPADSSEK
jgi:AN1-type zinc finger protein 1